VKAWESLVAEKTGVAYHHNPLSPYEKPTTSKISYDRLHEAFGDVIRVKVEDRAGANIHEMMERYVHKKLHQPRRFSSKCSDYSVEFDNKEFEMPNIATMPPVKKRKSVIVRAGGAASKTESGKDNEEGGPVDLPDMDSSIEDMLASIGEPEDILLTTGLYPILGAYCEDESRKLMHITDIFMEEWRRLDLGANIVAEYIHFCQYKPEFPPAFFKSVNLVIRERCLAFISCLEELEQVSYSDQILLFKRNLDNVEMLAYVFAFNCGSVEAEIQFALGEKDMVQWKERDKSVTGANLSSVVSFMPISEEDKFSLYTNLMRCTMAPMKDLSTYVLLVLIVAFDGAPEGSVAAKLRANFQTMLARYLSQKKNGGNIEGELASLYECCLVLPLLAKPFQGIKYAFEYLKSNPPPHS